MQIINIFKHNVQKWSKILEKPLGLNTASFLQQPFVNIMKELIIPKQFVHFQAILLSFSKERRDAKFPFSFKTLILNFFEILFLKISKTNTVSFILS